MADKEKDAATALAVDGYLECRGCGDKLTARVANIVADEMGQDRLIFAREELERAEAKGWQIIYEGNSICPECAGRCDNALLKPVGRTCLSIVDLCRHEHKDWSMYCEADGRQHKVLRVKLSAEDYSRTAACEELTARGWRMLPESFYVVCPKCIP